MIDGVINNGRRGEELEKAQEYAERATPEKPSNLSRMEGFSGVIRSAYPWAFSNSCLLYTSRCV